MTTVILSLAGIKSFLGLTLPISCELKHPQIQIAIMPSILQIYLVISCLTMYLSSTLSSPSKDRSPPRIEINGVDATKTDDLLQFMSQKFSPKMKNKASSVKSNKVSSKSEQLEEEKHHREKRFIWITKEKRIVLPPGTQLVLTPTLGIHQK